MAETNKIMREQAAMRIEQSREQVKLVKNKQYSLEKHIKIEHRIEMSSLETSGAADRYNSVQMVRAFKEQRQNRMTQM
jgi:hypothetical protein